MKKKILAAVMVLILVLAAAGCGSSGGDDSSDGQTEIAPKKLTDDEQHIVDMLNVIDKYSTGILEFKGDERTKSVSVKVMEYHAGAKKWSCINKSGTLAGKNGEIIVSYSGDGTQLDCTVANGKDDVGTISATGIKRFPKNKEGMEMSTKLVSSPLTLNKDIAVHMVAYSKTGDNMDSASVEDYPKLEAFKAYQYVRVVVLNFSDKSLDEE